VTPYPELAERITEAEFKQKLSAERAVYQEMVQGEGGVSGDGAGDELGKMAETIFCWVFLLACEFAYFS